MDKRNTQVGTAQCQNEVPEDFGNKLSKIPSFENFSQSVTPSIEDVQDEIKQKCEQNGGTSAFEILGIQEELKKFQKNGSVDEVFAKYCLKTSAVQNCIRKLTTAVKPCFDKEEQFGLKLVLNITDSLSNFVCHKYDDRVAMFVAEGRFQCIESRKVSIEKCVNKTLGHRISAELSLNNLLSLVISKKSCNDYENLQRCVVSMLETWEDNTPANIVDALLKYIRQISSCKNNPTSVFGAHQRVLRSYNNQQGLNGPSDVFNQVKEKYEPQCLKNGGQIAADKFCKALGQVKSCSSVMHSTLIEKAKEVKGIPFDYLCKEFRVGIRNCLSTLAVEMATCSSPQEAYAPKFGIDLYDSIFNFYCKHDARALKKFLEERDVCMNRIHNSTRFCLNKTKHIEMYAKDDVVTKRELCGDLKTLRNCFLDIAAQQCTNNANTNEFIVGLSDAMYAPCAGCKPLVSSFLVLLIFLFKVF